MRLAKLLLVSVFIMFPLANADPVLFDIGGMKVGDKLTEEFAYSHCPAKDKGKPERVCSKFIKVGGDDVFVSYYFENFSLIGVSLLYDSDLFEDIVAAYTGKFGQSPHEENEEVVVTKLGAKYVNKIKSWDTTSGKFLVRKYGNSVDKGHAFLKSDQYMSYLNRKKKEKQRKLGGEL